MGGFTVLNLLNSPEFSIDLLSPFLLYSLPRLSGTSIGDPSLLSLVRK